jgi:hypothetical protein
VKTFLSVNHTLRTLHSFGKLQQLLALLEPFYSAVIVQLLARDAL